MQGIRHTLTTEAHLMEGGREDMGPGRSSKGNDKDLPSFTWKKMGRSLHKEGPTRSTRGRKKTCKPWGVLIRGGKGGKNPRETDWEIIGSQYESQEKGRTCYKPVVETKKRSTVRRGNKEPGRNQLKPSQREASNRSCPSGKGGRFWGLSVR